MHTHVIANTVLYALTCMQIAQMSQLSKMMTKQ